MLFMVSREFALAGLQKPSAYPWDISWYANIIQYGYHADPNDAVEHNVVYFPLYPALCWLVLRVLPVPIWVAMLFVSAGATLIMLVLLHRLLTAYYSSFLASACVLLLAFSPFSTFLYAGYTEAVYICLTVAFFYFLTKSSYGMAALISGLASATRPYGCLLALVLIFETARLYYREHGFKWSSTSRYLPALLWLPFCFSGLIAYTLYLGYRFHDPLMFSHGLKAWVVMEGKIRILDAVTFRYLLPLVGGTLVHFKLFHPMSVGLALYLCTAVLLIFLGKRLFPSALVFILLMFLFFHYTLLLGDAPDIGRHFSLLFPVPLLLVLALEPRRVEGWLRNLIASASGRDQPPCACVTLVSVLPYAVLLLVSAGLSALYTVMFYRAEFVF